MARLNSVIDALTSSQMVGAFVFEDRDRNARDVLVHLHEWHHLLLDWASANLAGDAKPFLPPPHTWRDYASMNIAFRDNHQKTTFPEARTKLTASHEEVLSFIRRHSDEELFTKRFFTWTGTTSLGSYCVSATSSHYDWALKKIRKHRQTTS